MILKRNISNIGNIVTFPGIVARICGLTWRFWRAKKYLASLHARVIVHIALLSFYPLIAIQIDNN